MLLTISDDVRVILIKLADRLYKTLDLCQAKTTKNSLKPLHMQPLAHRLGLYSIKTELEDLGLKYTEPEMYKDIARQLNETKKARIQYIQRFTKPLKIIRTLLNFSIKGRPKSFFSIRKKWKIKVLLWSSLW